MFKLTIKHKQTYGEIPQANPLRWRIMYREKKELVSQSALIKCKDFFNDVVAWKNAQAEIKIYGFDIVFYSRCNYKFFKIIGLFLICILYVIKRCNSNYIIKRISNYIKF